MSFSGVKLKHKTFKFFSVRFRMQYNSTKRRFPERKIEFFVYYSGNKTWSLPWKKCTPAEPLKVINDILNSQRMMMDSPHKLTQFH